MIEWCSRSDVTRQRLHSTELKIGPRIPVMILDQTGKKVMFSSMQRVCDNWFILDKLSRAYRRVTQNSELRNECYHQTLMATLVNTATVAPPTPAARRTQNSRNKLCCEQPISTQSSPL